MPPGPEGTRRWLTSCRVPWRRHRPACLTDNASDTLRGIALAVLAYLIWTLGDRPGEVGAARLSALPGRCCGAASSAPSRWRR